MYFMNTSFVSYCWSLCQECSQHKLFWCITRYQTRNANIRVLHVIKNVCTSIFVLFLHVNITYTNTMCIISFKISYTDTCFFIYHMQTVFTFKRNRCSFRVFRYVSANLCDMFIVFTDLVLWILYKIIDVLCIGFILVSFA